MSRQARPSTIGIVGYGRLGSTLSRLLKPYYRIVAFDPYAIVPEHIRADSLRGLACQSDVILLTVRPDSLEAVVNELSQLASECGFTAVAESSSFKRGNIEKLSVLPENVRVAGIHPMFGHGASTTRGHSVIITPVPGRRGHDYVKSLFDTAGFKTIILEPEIHDKIMGVVLGIPYAVSLALDRLIGDNPRLYYESSGTTFKALYTIYATSISQADLAWEIVSRPESREAISQFIDALSSLLDGSMHSRESSLGYIDVFYKALYCLVEECLREPAEDS